MKSAKNDTKRVFLKKGACSHTYFYLLNREFGHLKDNEEQASDPLAGGIFQQGYQCGMLWGAALAVGAESFRRNNDQGKAIAQAITATQHIMKSFLKRAKNIECYEITNCNFKSKFGLAKYMLMGKPIKCFNLAARWTQEAIHSAKEGLSVEPINTTQMPISCASVVAEKMGASNEEIIMVAGFAGGLGLSGNGCGALASAIWLKTLARVRKQNYKYSISDTVIEKILKSFYEQTGYEMECSKICGKRFNTIDEHTEFIKNGGCEKLINLLGETSSIT